MVVNADPHLHHIIRGMNNLKNSVVQRLDKAKTSTGKEILEQELKEIQEILDGCKIQLEANRNGVVG